MPIILKKRRRCVLVYNWNDCPTVYVLCTFSYGFISFTRLIIVIQMVPCSAQFISAKHVIIQLWQTHLWRFENRFKNNAFLDSFHHFIHSSGLHVLRNCGFCEKINTVFIEDGRAGFTFLDSTSTSKLLYCFFLSAMMILHLSIWNHIVEHKVWLSYSQLVWCCLHPFFCSSRPSVG